MLVVEDVVVTNTDDDVFHHINELELSVLDETDWLDEDERDSVEELEEDELGPVDDLLDVCNDLTPQNICEELVGLVMGVELEVEIGELEDEELDVERSHGCCRAGNGIRCPKLGTSGTLQRSQYQARQRSCRSA